jgi:hypothetical protein
VVGDGYDHANPTFTCLCAASLSRIDTYQNPDGLAQGRVGQLTMRQNDNCPLRQPLGPPSITSAFIQV